MINLVFGKGRKKDLTLFQDFETFFCDISDSNSLSLRSIDEFELLISLLEINFLETVPLTNSSVFNKYYEISIVDDFELHLSDFDSFYKQWIKKSGRENTMDEYGQLIFLENFFKSSDKKDWKFVLEEQS